MRHTILQQQGQPQQESFLIQKREIKMQYVLQIIYAIIGIASTVLDHFIYGAFVKDYHHSIYIDLSQYTDYGEAGVCLILVIIGLFTEMGHFKTDAQKKTWVTVVDVLYTLAFMESVVRATSMTMVAIHVHPGKIDFMGLFVVITIFYFILKLMVIVQLATGLADRIKTYKPPSVFAYIPREFMTREKKIVHQAKEEMQPQIMIPQYYIHQVNWLPIMI
eukprot:TRINITY_DN88515_c0_g1_i1.p1 TRINITY_DN88515_c0_g1~~TRINITY_DN88515_c0_g1_i1.p1  ORF type:complete len:234 (-),score=5.77 TRINITY_DN88515_c0_g1_i1:110-766(-)